MTKIITDTVYKWNQLDVMFAGVSAGGSGILEISFDNTTFNPAGVLPLPTGEEFAQFNIRNCYFKFTGVTGEINVTPHVSEPD